MARRGDQPDAVCLQELKAPQEKFPAAAIEKAGYGAIWHGQQRWNGVAILARGCEPVETCRGLPGDPEDVAEPLYRGGGRRRPDRRPLRPQRQSAARAQVRLQARLERAADRARRRAGRRWSEPVVLAGDYNVIPTRPLDVYKPERWADDALMQPEPQAAVSPARRPGLDRRACASCIRRSRSSPSGTIGGTPSPATPASASTICCSTRPRRSG